MNNVAVQIGIVGGGFSGLLSAWLLERLLSDEAEIVVLEAGDQAGGRVRTTLVPEAGVSYEAGVAEFYDIAGNPQLRHLVRHLGLETRPLTGTPSFVLDGRVVHDDAELAGWLGQRGIDQVRRFWERGTALRPPADYALAGRPQDNEHPWLHRTFEDVLGEIDDARGAWFTAMQCHSDLAADPARTSGLFGMDNLLIDHPGYCTMYTLTGGNDGLIRALAAQVTSPVERSVPVTSVRADDKRGIQVRCTTTGGPQTRDFDALILTLPPAGLRALQWADATLSDAVDTHIRHHDHGTAYLRVTLLFRRRFWRGLFPDDYFVSDAFGGVTVYDQSPDVGAAGVGIQSWLIAGTDALVLAARPDADIVAAVLRAMPSGVTVPDGALITGCVDRWTGVAGVSGLPGGVPLLPLDRRHAPDTRWPQLLFVGDYLYDSTLCGALDAVLHVVTRLAGRLSGRPLAPDAALALFAPPSGAVVASPDPVPHAAFFLEERSRS